MSTKAATSKTAFANAKRGTSFKFDPTTIKIPAFTGRHVPVTEEAVIKMAKSFILEGQLQDIGVRKEFDEAIAVFGITRLRAAKYINGHKKWAAEFAKENGVEFNTEETFMIRATYFAVNPAEAAILTMLENADDTRNPVTPVDQAFMIRDLNTKFGYSDADIARKMGKLPSEISNLKKLLELDGAIQEQVSNGTLKLAQALAVTNVEPEFREQAVAKAREAGNGKVTAAGIQNAAKALGAKTKGSQQMTMGAFLALLKPIADGPTSPEKIRALAIWDVIKGRGGDLKEILADKGKKAAA